MVFYRKYRPQNFEELIGQEHVKNTLLSAFQSGKLAHAYLFCGPRGSGKTSTARILAKIVNCESQPSAVSNQSSAGRAESRELKADSSIPCNKCDTCVSITDGSNMDLIEIDAASNRGIDDIRDLREKIKLSPSSAKLKVYIIDEVHMLTTEAFNALLKTLEEPPSHVLFILATTEVQKLPQTILSRVQRFDFKLATSEQIRSVLRNICDKEKLKLADEILSLIAQSSEGSFRDAVKLLDQVASSGDKITLEEAQSLLKANDFSEVIGLIENLVAKDAKSALLTVQKMNEKGTNMKELMNSLMRVFRQILLIQNGAGEGIKLEVGSEKRETLQSISARIEEKSLVFYIENFQKGLEQLKFTSIASLPLEVSIIKSCQSSAVSHQPASQNVVIPNASEESINTKQIATSPVSSASRNDEVKNDSKPAEIPSVESMQTTDDVVIITDKWTYILETIRPYNYSLEALLKQAKVKNCDGVNVVLEVPYSFHQRILDAPKSRTLLESILADVLGKSVKVTTVLGKREVKASELANVEVAQDDEIVRLAAEIFNS